MKTRKFKTKKQMLNVLLNMDFDKRIKMVEFSNGSIFKNIMIRTVLYLHNTNGKGGKVLISF